MGQIAHALIEHCFTPGQIIDLPKRLQLSSNVHIAGQWTWTTPILDEKLLSDIWNRKPEFFIQNSWSVADLALLEKANMTITSISPNLLTFDNLLRWDIYKNNELLRRQFNNLTREIIKLLNATDVIMVPDLSSVDFFDDIEILSVEAYRQKAKGNIFYSIEVN